MTQKECLEWKGILVYLQCRKGSIHPSGEELIGEAVRLSGKSGEAVCVLGIGNSMEKVQKELEAYPVEKAFLYETSDIFDPCLYASLASACIREQRPSVVLIGGTLEGRALAPRLAVEFRTGLTADCTSLEMDEQRNLIQTRPAFGGNVMASILTENSRPQFATVRPGIMKPVRKVTGHSFFCSLQKVTGNGCKAQICVKESVNTPVAVGNCRFLIAAGRGVRKKEDLSMLNHLAELSGGELACSRALVEKGWMSPERQIGISGNSVRPECLLTIGISGTVQFMAGMRHAKKIIAVNQDPQARIFEIAHYPICADLYEIVPELIKRMEQEDRKSSRGYENAGINEKIVFRSDGSMSNHSGD